MLQTKNGLELYQLPDISSHDRLSQGDRETRLTKGVPDILYRQCPLMVHPSLAQFESLIKSFLGLPHYMVCRRACDDWEVTAALEWETPKIKITVTLQQVAIYDVESRQYLCRYQLSQHPHPNSFRSPELLSQAVTNFLRNSDTLLLLDQD